MKRYTAKKRHTKRKRRRQNRRTRKGGRQSASDAYNSFMKRFGIGKQTQQPYNPIDESKYALQDRINLKKRTQLNNAKTVIKNTFPVKSDETYTDEQKDIYKELNNYIQSSPTPTISDIQSVSGRFRKLNINTDNLEQYIDNHEKLSKLLDLINTLDVKSDIEQIMTDNNLIDNIDKHIAQIQTTKGIII